MPPGQQPRTKICDAANTINLSLLLPRPDLPNLPKATSHHNTNITSAFIHHGRHARARRTRQWLPAGAVVLGNAAYDTLVDNFSCRVQRHGPVPYRLALQPLLQRTSCLLKGPGTSHSVQYMIFVTNISNHSTGAFSPPSSTSVHSP